jgi:hypothetical protein
MTSHVLSLTQPACQLTGIGSDGMVLIATLSGPRDVIVADARVALLAGTRRRIVLGIGERSRDRPALAGPVASVGTSHPGCQGFVECRLWSLSQSWQPDAVRLR